MEKENNSSFQKQILQNSIILSLADWQVTAESEKPTAKLDDHVKKFELPRRHLDLDEFVLCVQECGIVKDVETIHRLFDALTDGESREAIRTVLVIPVLTCHSIKQSSVISWLHWCKLKRSQSYGLEISVRL